MRYLALLLVFLTLSAPLAAQQDFELSYLLVRRADGRVLDALESEKLRTPASTMKIVTAAAAWERLGPAHRYRTTLWTQAQMARRLQGDLALRGDADPELDQSALASLASQLHARGVRWVDGDLLVDEGPYADPPYGAGWAWDDAGESYSPEISGLAVDGGLVEVGPNLKAPWLTVRPAPGSAVRLIPGREGVEILGDPPDRVAPSRSALLTGELFVAKLRQQGIRIRGSVKVGTASGREVAEHESRPLSEILRQALVTSDNRAMELIDRSAGSNLPRVLEGQRLRRADGSGLSRYNLLSAQQLVSVLLDKPELCSLFPAGGEGTLVGRFLQGAAGGQVKAKTGTLGNVSGLAGYLFAGTPEECAFAILINGHVDSTAQRKAIENSLVEGWAGRFALRPADAKRSGRPTCLGGTTGRSPSVGHDSVAGGLLEAVGKTP